MDTLAITQNTQYIAWFLALVNLVLGLYILVLNPRHTANRHTLMLMLLFALQSAGAGMMMGAYDMRTGQVAGAITAISSAAAQPALLLTALVVLKPRWLKSWRGHLIRLLYLFINIPILLTVFDIWQGTSFWYSGLPAGYAGGFLPSNVYTQGTFSNIIRLTNITLPSLFVIPLYIYVGGFDRGEERQRRKFAWILLGAHIATSGLMMLSLMRGNWDLPLIFINAAYLLAFGYGSFQNMISPLSEQAGSLETRLTSLVLAVSVPILIAVTLLVTIQARANLAQEEEKNLETINRSLNASFNFWLDFNVRALQELATRPEIYNMDPSQQKPLLERLARTYPHMYLVSTTNLDGVNVARSDTETAKDYSDRAWFLEARRGTAVNYQTLVGRTSGQPAVFVSTPIRNPNGSIVGVVMFASDLDVIASQIQNMGLSEGGVAYVLDQTDQIVAHPDRQFTAELRQLSTYPPVAAARAGAPGKTRFVDAENKQWVAFTSLLPNNWVVVVQAPSKSFLSTFALFQRTTVIGLAAGIVILFLLAALTIHQGFRPIQNLTETASAIAQGDVEREARVENQDEVGLLAEAFNQMTRQLRSLIADLEARVSERTQDLEKRAVQLQVTAEVAREALSITELEALLSHATNLISRRFHFYHTGLFLLDENREYAYLRAASSEGGQRMMARKHRLKVGQEGIVGTVAGSGKPRISLDVGADAVYFNNPDLPGTRSEVALPLLVRNQVIGVLDVQSTEAWAFKQEDLEILQILADQIAMGIENARLLTESKQALQELQALYSVQTRTAWQKRLEDQAIIYHYTQTGVEPIRGNGFTPVPDESFSFEAPVTLRNQELGKVILRREPESGPWLEEEKALIQQTLAQVALALENARLLEEVQRHAYEERVVNEISAVAQRSLDVESVMKATVAELGRFLKTARVQIRLAQSEQSIEALSVSGDQSDMIDGNGSSHQAA